MNGRQPGDASRACLFCSIIAGHTPATIVSEWPDVIAIRPQRPVTSGHVLVIPRRHVMDVGVAPLISALAMSAAAELAAELEAANIITCRGAAAAQAVYHLSLHVIPRSLGDGLALPWTPEQTEPRSPGGRP